MGARIDRRSFLRTTAAAAATAVALPHVARGAEKRKLRIAIVGVGGRGGHALGLAKKEEVVALCDVDTGRMGRGKKMFPNAKIRQRRLVLIYSPESGHEPNIIEAARLPSEAGNPYPSRSCQGRASSRCNRATHGIAIRS
jgi:hypothetical protein